MSSFALRTFWNDNKIIRLAEDMLPCVFGPFVAFPPVWVDFIFNDRFDVQVLIADFEKLRRFVLF